MARSVGDLLPVRPVDQPAPDLLYRPFLVASLTMATAIGFVLGIHVSLGRALGTGNPERTADLVQAHGVVQLAGFAGLFVMGVSLRLMPRFAGSKPGFPALVPLVLWLVVTGLLLRAVVLPLATGDLSTAVMVTSSLCLLCAAGCFLLVVAGTLTVEARRFDASSLAFILGALQLFAAMVLSMLATIDAVQQQSSRLPYLANNAVLHMTLLGFILLFILGVALRAIPTMVGVPRPGRSGGILAVVVFVCSSAIGGSLIYVQYVGASDVATVAVALAFVALGLVLLTLVWQAGPVRRAGNRLRPASQPHLWLVRSAFVWLTFAALEMSYFGASALLENRLPSEFQFDAVRHTLGVGTVTMLIAGMALMILPEFAADRLGQNRQRRLALVLALLLNTAAVMRVLPSLAGTAWSFDERNALMAVAGTFAETALLIFAAYYFRLVWRARRVGGDRLG